MSHEAPTAPSTQETGFVIEPETETEALLDTVELGDIVGDIVALLLTGLEGEHGQKRDPPKAMAVHVAMPPP